MTTPHSYLTVRGTSQGQLEVKRSCFFSYLAHVESEQQAIGFRHSIRDAIPEASHYVSAYVIHQDNLIRFSDAKEPQGTAGMPVLNVVQHAALEDVVCVVARVFGGTLLGTGGLVRAYSKAAQLALESATIVTVAPCRNVEVVVEYALYEPVMRLLRDLGPQAGVELGQARFEQEVTVGFRVLDEQCQHVVAKVVDLCHGRVAVQVGPLHMSTIGSS